MKKLNKYIVLGLNQDGFVESGSIISACATSDALEAAENELQDFGGGFVATDMDFIKGLIKDNERNKGK